MSEAGGLAMAKFFQLKGLRRYTISHAWIEDVLGTQWVCIKPAFQCIGPGVLRPKKGKRGERVSAPQVAAIYLTRDTFLPREVP